MGAAAVVLAGCGGGPDGPRTLPPVPSRSAVSTSASAAVSSSPSPLPSLSPGVAGDVEAAVRAYYAAVNTALTTGHTSPAKALLDRGCSCFQLIKDIEATYKRGGRYVGARVIVSSVRIEEVHAREAGAEVRAQVAPYKRYGAHGSVVEDSNGGRLHDDLTLLKEANRWVVVQAVDLG